MVERQADGLQGELAGAEDREAGQGEAEAGLGALSAEQAEAGVSHCRAGYLQFPDLLADIGRSGGGRQICVLLQ